MEQVELGRLTIALQTLLNPNVEHDTRIAAINLCETYKNHNESASIGFFLSSNSDPTIRYFGLQIVKHTARFKWTSLSEKEKVEIQKHLLEKIADCTIGEPLFIKSAFASCLCEIVKHVWPQHWPQMLDELFEICGRNVKPCAEVVATMLEMLVEDVVLYQNITLKARCRELRQALTVSSNQVMRFLQYIIKSQIESNGNKNVATSAIKTLSVYLEWIGVEQIFTKETEVLKLLFQLLNPKFSFNLASAQCLLNIATRKGTAEENKMVLKLTDSHVVKDLIDSVQCLQSFDEDSFTFLKVISKIFSSLVGHVVHLFQDKEKSKTEFPLSLEPFTCFLEAAFNLANHQSQVVAQPMILASIQLLRHSEIRKDSFLQSSIPHLLQIVNKHLCHANSDNCYVIYEELDFGDEGEIKQFKKQFRSNCIELLRYCTVAMPIQVLNACCQSVEATLNSPEVEAVNFEGLMTSLETVVSCALSSAEENNLNHLLPVDQAKYLFNCFVTKQTSNPEIQKGCLNSAYALCKLVSLSSDAFTCFQMLFKKLFSLLDETQHNSAVFGVSSLRRYAGVVLIRVAKYYPRICLSLLDEVKMMVMERSTNNLSPFERVSLFETLILISNEKKNFLEQSNLIQDILATSYLASATPQLEVMFQNPQNFAQAIGLCDATSEEGAKLRGDIFYFLALTLAVLSRSKLPENEQDCQLGKFFQNGKLTNPCKMHIGQAMNLTLTLTRLFSLMWSPEVSKVVHSENLQALEIRECEKKSLICKNFETISATNEITEPRKSEWERIQIFLISNLSTCYQIIGLASKVFPEIFYSQSIFNILDANVFVSIATLPVLRFKSLIRMFLINYLKNCPAANFVDTGISILTNYCQIMLERLQPQWNEYEEQEKSRINGDSGKVENKPDDDIIKEQLLRILTREHLDLLVTVCVNKNPNPKQNGDCIDMPSSGNLAQLTEFGACIASGPTASVLLTNGLLAISWCDTTSCFKAVQLLWPFLKLLIRDKIEWFTEQTVGFIFEGILKGLYRHGDHDGIEAQISSLAIMMMQALTHHKPVFQNVLCSALPHVDRRTVEDFVIKFVDFSEKQRKVGFKRLTSGLIERHVSQKFKETQNMISLGPLFISNKQHNARGDDVNLAGVAQLFHPI